MTRQSLIPGALLLVLAGACSAAEPGPAPESEPLGKGPTVPAAAPASGPTPVQVEHGAERESKAARGPARAAGAPAGEAARPAAGQELVPHAQPGRHPIEGRGPFADGRLKRPEVERIDEHRARIENIEIDRKERSFKVPGKVLWEQGPLEFLAIAPGGRKGYESLLELDADAYEFNLACMLIGLRAPWAKGPRHHFDPRPAIGKTVAVQVSWEGDGERVEVPAHTLLFREGSPEPSNVWVYTGSRFGGRGRFQAAADGTLIGFVHDPASIVEHREGFGLGDYGSVQVRTDLLPKAGTPIELKVRWMSREESGVEPPPGSQQGRRRMGVPAGQAPQGTSGEKPAPPAVATEDPPAPADAMAGPDSSNGQ